MSRPKLPGFTLHLHFDPYVRVMDDDHSKTYGGDERMDKFLAWYDSQPRGTRTKMVMQLLVSVLNGELGSGVQWAVESGNEEELRLQMEAAKAVFANFVVE